MNILKQKIALGVEYDGSAFHGWQKQADVLSVQATLESALNTIAGMKQNPNSPFQTSPNMIQTICAGRTDSGVHATNQIVHFETIVQRNERAWVMGTNAELPTTIKVLWAKNVPDHFNARRSATRRRYRYVIYNSPIRPCLQRKLVTWYYRSLDVDKMRLAAQYWIGEHDFSSFRASACQSHSPVRTLYSIRAARLGEYILLEFEANAFLQHMVRNMVGVLLMVGSQQAEISWAREVLQGKDRTIAGMTAPPEGLYLVNVEYPSAFSIPQGQPGPWFLKLNEDCLTS